MTNIERARRKARECSGESTENGGRNSFGLRTEGPKIESDKNDSDFECYNKSDGKPLHVDIDKEGTEGGPALA